MSLFKSLFKKRYSARTPPSLRQVVDGVVYDTDRATFLTVHGAKHLAGGGVSMFLEFNKYLFRSDLGNFFLVMVPIGHPGGIPTEERRDAVVLGLGTEEAFQWLSQNHEVALLEQHFSDRLTRG